jgi:hypothetical protein
MLWQKKALTVLSSFLAQLKVTKLEHCETDYITLLVTVIETGGSTFSLLFKFFTLDS